MSDRQFIAVLMLAALLFVFVGGVFVAAIIAALDDPDTHHQHQYRYPKTGYRVSDLGRALGTGDVTQEEFMERLRRYYENRTDIREVPLGPYR